MAYNNNGDTKTYSAKYVERPNSRGGDSKYFSFTMEIGGSMYTCRVYALSTYKPASGKNKDKECCPVRVTKWSKTRSSNNKW